MSLEVKSNSLNEIVIGSEVYSPRQAKDLAHYILQQAMEAEKRALQQREEAKRKAAEAIPVDRRARVLTDGSPVTEDHREILKDGVREGQQKGYVVLSEAERAKGFVRPLRRTYLHKPCGTTTTMGNAIAETYARDPKFYDGTFCVHCKQHFPLDQFVWDGTDEQVGS